MLKKDLVKKTSICTITAVFYSLIMMFPIASVTASPTTYLSVINPETGNSNFILPEDTPVNFTFVVNITVTDVTTLKGWQINLTWDPTLLEIAQSADMSYPADNIFSVQSNPGFILQPFGKTINNADGTVYWGAALGAGSDPTFFSGSGVMCQIIFTVTQALNSTVYTNLHLELEYIVRTKLITTGGATIPFTPQDGHYEIIPEFPTVILPALFLIATLLAFALGKKARSVKQLRRPIAK